MPNELSRILRTIRELDYKCELTRYQIQDNFDALMKFPPSKAGSEEVKSMRAALEADQRMLIQWCEEKVQLATQGYDLLDAHYGQLETDISTLTAELHVTGQLTDDIFQDEHFQEPDPPISRRSASRLQQYGSFDLDGETSLTPAPPTQPAVSNRKASISRQQSSFASDEYAPVVENMAWEATTAPKSQGRSRRGSEGAYGGTLRRRAASAAVQATAQALAALEDDDPYQNQKMDNVGPTVMGLDPNPGVAPLPMLEPFLPGLEHAAKEPQAPGRILTVNDVSPNLVGRIAEVFWLEEGNSDGNLWYLVKIESVDMVRRTASIRYQNGEMEEALSLDDVARERHMRLVDF